MPITNAICRAKSVVEHLEDNKNRNIRVNKNVYKICKMQENVVLLTEWQ
jgi:hypothetical protein